MGFLKKGALFAISLLIALVCLDAYLQLAEIQTPMETRIDPELGPTYIPNKRITRFNEGFFMGSVNAYGYMGPSRPPQRIGTEKRVLLLGDSFVLGHTVLPRQYFGRYLEERLRNIIGQEVQALNFGKADFNVENMYQYFRDFAGKFDHDLALFFVGEGDLVPTGQVATNLYPTVRLEGESLVIDKSFRTTRTYHFYKAIEPLMVRSSVLRLIFNTYKIINGGSWRIVVFDKFAALAAPKNEEGQSSELAQEQPGLPDVNRAILKELSKDRRNVLVIQTDLDPELLREIEAIGIPIINLGAFLEGLRAQGKDPYYWPVTRMRGHWNHESQPLIGKFLADRISELGLL